MRKELVFFYFLLVGLDLIFEFFNLNTSLLFIKNSIPLFLFFAFFQIHNFSIEKEEYLIVAAFVLLLFGLNFSYFCYTQTYYLPVLTIIYFFEIQIQLYQVLKKLKKVNTRETKTYTKTFLIISLGLFFIIVFFPLFSFPVQVLFFIRVFQFAYYITLVFGNKKVDSQISWSLWLIILSNVLLLVDLAIFDYKLAYAIIMLPFYASKFFYLNGYLRMKEKIIQKM